MRTLSTLKSNLMVGVLPQGEKLFMNDHHPYFMMKIMSDWCLTNVITVAYTCHYGFTCFILTYELFESLNAQLIIMFLIPTELKKVRRM